MIRNRCGDHRGAGSPDPKAKSGGRVLGPVELALADGFVLVEAHSDLPPAEVLGQPVVVVPAIEAGVGGNPWRTHSRFLISRNLLIDPGYTDAMREWLGSMLPGSLLILDEAHHAAPANGGHYGIETKLTRVVRDLGGRFEHRLFLSATPHNGHSNSFSTLLELLDPYRFTRGVKVRGEKALEDVMVRRLKEDIRQVQADSRRV